jgi:hypothetical protein
MVGGRRRKGMDEVLNTRKGFAKGPGIFHLHPLDDYVFILYHQEK